MRLEALQHAVLLLPDEHREALQTLLYFLHDIANHSDTNNVCTLMQRMIDLFTYTNTM